MSAPIPISSEPLVELTTSIVIAYVAGNSLSASELPTLINRVHQTIADLASGTMPTAGDTHEAEAVVKPTPSQIRRSVQDDGIISFLDGKAYKTLKRHLTSHGLNPQSYRKRYGLPTDYPMVSPNYAKRRSDLAKGIGLGRSAVSTFLKSQQG